MRLPRSTRLTTSSTPTSIPTDLSTTTMKIGIGVNEYVVLGASEGRNHSLQSHGLSGCVLVVITDSLSCYFAHVSRISPGEPLYLEQMTGLQQSIRGVGFVNPTITIVGQSTPFGVAPNVLRLQSLTKQIFPRAECNLVTDKGASVKFGSSLCWDIISHNDSDYSGNHNTIDAAAQGINCGMLTPESGVCRASSVTES